MKINLNYLIVFFTIFMFSSCKSSEETISFEQIARGKCLDKVQEIPVDEFFQIWLHNMFPVKIDVNCKELFKDDSFTYFGKNKIELLASKTYIYKVNSKTLDSLFPNYSEIKGNIISRNFYDLYVPESDKKIIEESKCTKRSFSPKYKYELQNKKIMILLHLKFECNRKLLIDKNYIGSYDLIQTKFDIE